MLKWRACGIFYPFVVPFKRVVEPFRDPALPLARPQIRFGLFAVHRRQIPDQQCDKVIANLRSSTRNDWKEQGNLVNESAGNTYYPAFCPARSPQRLGVGATAVFPGVHKGRTAVAPTSTPTDFHYFSAIL